MMNHLRSGTAQPGDDMGSGFELEGRQEQKQKFVYVWHACLSAQTFSIHRLRACFSRRCVAWREGWGYIGITWAAWVCEKKKCHSALVLTPIINDGHYFCKFNATGLSSSGHSLQHTPLALVSHTAGGGVGRAPLTNKLKG